MTSAEGERRLAAVMYTDMVGYTALGQRNETLSLALVEEQRKLIRPILARHDGREVKTMGDAFLVEFPNATDSIRCAYDIQRAIREFNLALVSDKRIHLRIGIHLGEVVESQGDISGDAVNVASRIYPLAEDGGVCLTRHVYDQVSNKTELKMASIGVRPLKNVNTPIEVYKMEMPWEQPVPSKEAVALPRDRLAILPFANMSPDPNDEYFADGITDEIITTASGISGLQVISRTSVMRYKKTDKGVKEIGRELEVGSVLEGSFKKSGNRIRVTAQLIDVAGDRHLWAQNYDRDLDDVFEVQSGVAKQVAEALRVKILSPELERLEKKPTESTAAYTLYLKGVYMWGKRTGERPVEAVKEAAQCFERAIGEDPEFALACAGLAYCSNKFHEFGIGIGANAEKAKRMSARALELDPGLAEAHSAYGTALMYSYDISGAEDEFRKAIQSKPSDTSAHNGYYWILSFRHRWDEALEHIETAVGLDPLSPLLAMNHAAFYYYRGDYSKALELYQRSVDLGGSTARASVASTYGRMRRFEEMTREYEAWVDLRRGSLPLAEEYARLNVARFRNDNEAFRKLLRGIESHFGEENGPAGYEIASDYFYLGEKDKGFEWLEHSYSRREHILLWITIHPDLGGVRTDPRYLDLLKRLGLG
ncbi:MAG TPA: adenylate/guanylate cyclase domain-containing protein [Nitrososphaerales archaeon]|nr:adenylate/guanylate cyclase domain-containing protein [Nitrososphaerales archaeon]